MPIDAVDRALRLALLLHQEGPLRVADVAERLGVARSTAHRLLGSLVHRDFAAQDPDRRYRAGPALRLLADPEPVAVLRAVALPHLRVLVEGTRETAQLTTRIGTRVRFVATVVCDQRRRVGDREGRTLPAHLASGGLASLAALPRSEVDALYAGRSEPDPAALARLLSPVRQRGFALNDQATEPGVTAIGRAIAGPGRLPGAVSLSVPSERFARHRIREWAEQLAAAASGIEVAMVAATGH